ncbi:MAG TPA: cation:proton antiporter, partial [Solirubrobacteraceae bacterium]
MDAPSFSGLLVVVAVAFAVPFTLGLLPRVKLPAVVLELVLGIVIGPAVLGWVQFDTTISVVALIGLVFLLFLAGLEIEFEHLRGRVLKLTALGWLASFAIAVAIGYALKGGGLVQTPLLVAVILSATSLGVIIPVLKDAGEIATPFGQLVIAGGTIADFGAIILLSILFTGEGGTTATLLLIAALLAMAFALYLVVTGAERSRHVMEDLQRLQDTTAQIRVRGAIVVLIAFAALAEKLGLEVILGAFAAGAVLTLVDRDRYMTHPLFRTKLEAIGFGFFVPVFFVSSGVRFDLDALLSSMDALVKVPVFLLALLAIRGLPALAYRRDVGDRRALVAGLFQATSLPFIVAATAIGLELGLIGGGEAAALVAAGLLSLLLFPLAGLTILRGGGGGGDPSRPAGGTGSALGDRDVAVGPDG